MGLSVKPLMFTPVRMKPLSDRTRPSRPARSKNHWRLSDALFLNGECHG